MVLFLFTHTITLRAYLSAEVGVMVLLASRQPTPYSTCWSSSEMVQVSLGRPCEPSISVVSTMYASSSLRRWVSWPTSNLTIFSVIFFLTVLLLISPNLMRYHRCFSEEGHETHLLKDEEAYIVETTEIEGAHGLPRDNCTISDELQQVLDGVGRRDANNTITPDSALSYACRVIARVNKEEDNVEGQKRKTRTAIIKVSGLSHKREINVIQGLPGRCSTRFITCTVISRIKRK